jgi:hypothetical protein
MQLRALLDWIEGNFGGKDPNETLVGLEFMDLASACSRLWGSLPPLRL